MAFSPPVTLRQRLARTLVGTLMFLAALVSVGLAAPTDSLFSIEVTPVFLRLDAALGARVSNGSRAPSSRASRGTTCEFLLSFAGGAGLLGACSHFSDTLLAESRASALGLDVDIRIWTLRLHFAWSAVPMASLTADPSSTKPAGRLL